LKTVQHRRRYHRARKLLCVVAAEQASLDE
jgi:hypothetical protein